MEEFQIHHANEGRHVERNFLRCVIGNVDTPMLDIARKFTGLKDCLIVGMDPILLHGHMDMDVVLCGGHEVTTGRQKRTSYVLSHLGLGASCNFHCVWIDNSVHSGRKVRF